MTRLLALAVLALSGCAVGFGSAYVGEWRARQRVAVEACLVDDAGACTDHKVIAENERARHFWGVAVQFPALGAAQVSHDGKSSTDLRAEGSLEILSGYGRYAWGVRGGALYQGDVVAVPFELLGHLSLTERFGVYAGAGYSPYARFTTAGMPMQTTALGGRLLGGVQMAILHTFILSVEADSNWFDFAGGYHSTGLSGNVGFYF